MRILINILISIGLLLSISAVDHSLLLSAGGVIIMAAGVILDNMKGE